MLFATGDDARLLFFRHFLPLPFLHVSLCLLSPTLSPIGSRSRRRGPEEAEDFGSANKKHQGGKEGVARPPAQRESGAGQSGAPA